MKTRRLVRGEVTPRQLAAILDELGVAQGEEFTIASRVSYNPGDAPNVNNTVRGKTDASALAARRAWPGSGTQRYRIIEALVFLGQMTRSQLVTETGIAPNSLRPRVLEAIDGGWIEQADSVADNEVLRASAKAVEQMSVPA